MDASLSDTSQGYGASDVPNTSSNYIFESSSLEEHYDPDFDAFLRYLEGDDPNLQFSLNDLYNESSNASRAQSECKSQPRVYDPHPSLTFTYTPAPSAKLVELQCLPAQPLPADVSAPVIMPHHTLPADVVPHGGGIMPDKPSHMSPSHFHHADGACHISTPNMPPQQQPPAYPDSCHPDHNFMCCTGSQSHHNFTFSFSHVEAENKNQLPYDPFHDASKLRGPMTMHHHNLQNSLKLGLPRLVPTSPIACVTADGTASPAAADSDSVTMEMSSMSAPAAPATSNSSFNWTSMPPEMTSLSVPLSPTPSVNKEESRNEEIRSPSHGITQVALKVKTKLLNLHDGFHWKKYGEKIIKNQKYTRSYFKCDEKDRCKCKVVKRIQRCSSDEDSILFTYMGRHNHPP